MYVPEFNAETNLNVLHELIRSKPLGAWTTLAEEGLCVEHIPFMLHPERGEFGTLEGHVARVNPIWRNFSLTVASVVVFQGEQAYISPSWYPSKAEHGKVVPTWNYTVVHAYGVPQVHEDPLWLKRHLQELTAKFEGARAQPWQISDAPPEFIDSLSRAIVGIEIPIRAITGKWKCGQNRSRADQAGMVEGLAASDEVGARLLAETIRHRAGAVERD